MEAMPTEAREETGRLKPEHVEEAMKGHEEDMIE